MIKVGYAPCQQGTVFAYRGERIMVKDGPETIDFDIDCEEIPKPAVHIVSPEVHVEFQSLFTHQIPYSEELWNRLKEVQRTNSHV